MSADAPRKLPAPVGARRLLAARKRSRQPEPREHTGIEACEGADPVTGEREDEQAASMPDAGAAAKVGTEGRLTVGSSRHEVDSPARAEDSGEQAAHDVATLEFKGNRW